MNNGTYQEKSISLLGAAPVSLFPLPDSEKDLKTRAGILCSRFLDSLKVENQDGSSGKTCQAFYPLGEDEILPPSFKGWKSAGMCLDGGFLTLNFSVSPKDAKGCGLSHILETGNLSRKFFLSVKACEGILRRAEKRGKALPPMLHTALKEVVSVPSTPNVVQESSPTKP